MNGVTFGRHVSSDGREHFVTQRRNTLGGPNAGPKVGPVVISEIMYSPPPFGPDADTVDEFIELRNISDHAVPLYDPLYPTNAWRLNGAVQFTFHVPTEIPPWSFLTVVSFDPIHDPDSLAWFRRRYGLDANVLIVGPYQGHLGNQGEALSLYQPDTPELPLSPNAGLVPYVLVEEIHYSPLPPWPTAANGTGYSLQRLACAAFADDPANWTAGLPTVGAMFPGAATVDTDNDGIPDETEFIAGTDPVDAMDFLKFDKVSCDGINCFLEFTARSNRLYTVEKVPSLASPYKWTTLQSNLPGTGAPLTVRDPLGLTSHFYRLKAARQ